MRYINLLVLLWLAISVLACSESSGSKRKEIPSSAAPISDDSLLVRYLRNALQLSVPEAPHTYVLIAGNGCSGCQMTMVLRAQNQQHPAHVSFIFPVSYRQHFKEIPPNVFFDSTGKITRVKFHKGNICILRTKAGRIISNTLVEPAIVDTVTID